MKINFFINFLLFCYFSIVKSERNPLKGIYSIRKLKFIKFNGCGKFFIANNENFLFQMKI